MLLKMLLFMCEPHSMQAEASGWQTIPFLGNAILKMLLHKSPQFRVKLC